MKTLTTVCCFLLLSLGLGSCKKDRDVQPKNSLIGDWIEQDLNNYNSYTRRLNFSETNQFQMLSYQTTKDMFSYNGTYKVKQDSIKFLTVETIHSEEGKPEVKTATNYPVYEKATFNIVRDTLILKYISYPADAPVETTAKFLRPMKID
jgi:hypothetical protein